jgi:hypothetical protein
MKNKIILFQIFNFQGSVMHYESTAFAKDRNVPTIYAKNGGVLGNSKGFSPVR